VVDGRPETVGELRFGVLAEGARTVADLLDRRTRLGLVPADRERAVAEAEHILAEFA
jgi:glycerol-3-phosphate dehydrogenase